MMFTKDDAAQKVFATLPGTSGEDVYECGFAICANPLCTCNRVTVQFLPVSPADEEAISRIQKSITVNVENREIETNSESGTPLHQDMAFQHRVREHLHDEEYQFLYQEYMLYKRYVTEQADIASLQVDFPIDDIEQNNTMLGYTDVLPYAEYFTLPLDGQPYVFLDQYCVKPHCSCADAIISCMRLDEQGRIGEDVAAYTIQYKKRRWKRLDERRPELGTVGRAGELKRVIEAAYPAWYDQLRTRHSHLKTLYANCLKTKGIGLPQISKKIVGRNDPCPCGSGKKFKKCCLNTTQ